MMHRVFLVCLQIVSMAALLTLSACGGADSGSNSTALAAPDTPGPRFPASLDGLTPYLDFGSSQTRRIAGAVTQDDGYVVNTDSREEVRLFYKTVFGSSAGVSAGWTGDVSTCNAGDTSSDYKAATLRRINWFRAMAGMPGVQLDATFNAKAQQAALLMSANNQLSHFPPTNWTCYNGIGAEAAGKSNLHIGTSGSDAISAYMRDQDSNNNVVGHRRWLLYPQTQFMGTGDVVGSGNTRSANAQWVFDGNIFSPRPAVRDGFVAWPAKGYAPYDTVYPRWSISYPNADFSGAKVGMTENGVAIPTKLEPVTNGFGENTLVWIPGSYVDGMSWMRPNADTVYQVTVSNVRVNGQIHSVTYSVTVFDPEQDAVGTRALTLNGDANAFFGQASSYAFAAAPGATGYQWRGVSLAPLVFNDGSESGADNFAVSASAGYSVTSTDIRATGASSFHLAHVQPTDQILRLKSTLVGSPSAFVRFNSRLGLSSPGQTAKLEASVDEGKNWQVLFQQSGQQSGSSSTFGESSFNSKQVSLAQFADRSFQLRFRYEVTGRGSYYPQSTSGIGWYIDDVIIDGVQKQSAVGTPVKLTSNSFSYVPNATGTVFLQVQAGMYGFYGDWSGLKRIAVDRQTVVDGRDCVMNWAEKNYPALVAPAASSQVDVPYYFRYYSGSNSYLGFSFADDHMYYLGANGLIDHGHKTKWLAASGCQ